MKGTSTDSRVSGATSKAAIDLFNSVRAFTEISLKAVLDEIHEVDGRGRED